MHAPCDAGTDSDSDGEMDNSRKCARKCSRHVGITETQETCESIFTSTPPKIMNHKTAAMVMQADADRRARQQQEPVSLSFSPAVVCVARTWCLT
jgi:hypothetical protein